MLRRLANRYYLLRCLGKKIISWNHFIHGRSNLKIINKGGCVRLKKDILGKYNRIEIGHGAFLNKTQIRMHGNNNIIIINDMVKIGPECSLWCEGDNIIIYIGKGTTMTEKVHICAQENGCQISIGDNCMLSNNIIIRTSDSHPIYNPEGCRINPAKDVVIKDNVWIAPHSTIMKGAMVSEGCIIGSNTMVNQTTEAKALYVGQPAKLVKRNIKWTREKLF